MGIKKNIVSLTKRNKCTAVVIVWVLRIYYKLQFVEMNDETYIKHEYQKWKQNKLDLSNPVTFSQKLLYLKLHNRSPLLTLCADKYAVEEYVRDKGLGYILKAQYASYMDVDQIDWDALPRKFFVTCNHICGWQTICQDKDLFDVKHFKRLYKQLLKMNYYYVGREWPYDNIKPRIIFEEILENTDKSDLVDYKFFCFNGKSKYVSISIGEFNKSATTHKYNMQFESIDYQFKKNSIQMPQIKKPDNFEEMVAVAERLSEGFPFVRVDLYDVNERILFGEMTFYPSGGMVNIDAEELETELGEYINIELRNDCMVYQ